jgi:hypothetical protein
MVHRFCGVVVGVASTRLQLIGGRWRAALDLSREEIFRSVWRRTAYLSSVWRRTATYRIVRLSGVGQIRLSGVGELAGR